MTLYSIIVIFGITCLPIVSYGLPVVDENNEALYFENFDFLGESAGNETLTTGHQEASIEMRDFQGYADLNETVSYDIDGEDDGGRAGSGDVEPHPDDENVVDIGPPPYTDYAPDLCKDATIDTITRTKSGSTYVFKGDFYWKVHPNGISERYPRKISDDWDGLEGNLDASVTWSNGRTFFFKDRRYWRFTDKKMDRWYPKLISIGFLGIPDNLDAALVWGANGRTYFFKGDKYWGYDIHTYPPTGTGYPRETRAWGHVLADGIHAAFQWENKLTYLFKGDQYYRYNDRYDAIETYPPYPRSTAVEWFGCRSIYHKLTETN